MLLTAYADTEAAIRAINDIGLDHYLMKPWAPPEERLYPILDDLLDQWDEEHADRFEGVRVVGNRWSERAYDTRMFLARNHVPYQWLEIERNEEARRLLALFGGTDAELPLVLLTDGTVLRGETVREIADALGIRTSAKSILYDLVVVGAGPAGLAAAVYGASEGLHTAVIERDAPGGQAGQSARIENYLGFPNGLSGADLSHRAATQARRLGAEMVLARQVVGLEQRGPVHAVRFDDGTEIDAKAVLIATGVSYQLLQAPGLASADRPRRVLRRIGERRVEHGGRRRVHRRCGELGGPGGAPSRPLRPPGGAGRPRRRAREVDVEVPRRTGPFDRQHRGAPADRDRPRRGDDHLESLTLVDRATGVETEWNRRRWLFAFIGASPRTEWLGNAIARDPRGFVLTGTEVGEPDRGRRRTSRGRCRAHPYLLETSRPGVFAAGDVRLASMKRVASAVGEGSIAVSLVHLYLETL